MRDLLSKKSHRQLELLELLFENKRWFHISELAELLHYTERSVKDDLSQVRSSFPDLLFHSSTNGIRIINTDDSDIEMVYHHFFKHSTHFSILEFIFFNEDVILIVSAKSFISVLPLFIVSSVTLIKLLRNNIVLKLASIQFESLEMKLISVTFLPSIFQRNIISLNGLLKIFQ